MSAWGAAAGAIGGMLGGLFGANQSHRNTKETNRNNQDMAEKDRAMQREFAQQGIRWKVEDAKKAGIHPLAALGASTHSASPTAIGSIPDPTGADEYSKIGQNLGRAVHVGLTWKERATQKAAQNLEHATKVDNMDAEAQLMRAKARQIERMSGPAIPGLNESRDGQSGIKQVPVEVNMSRQDAQHLEAGNHPGYTFIRTGKGLTPVLAGKHKESVEDSPQEWLSQAIMGKKIVSGSLKPSQKDFGKLGIPKSKWSSYEWKLNSDRIVTGKLFSFP